MRRPLLLLLLLLLVGRAPTARPAPLVPPTGLQVQGVASCASMACHHANGPRGSKGSEYSTWVAADPHARAYQVLFDERSKAMLRRFRDLRAGQPSHPEKDPLCLSCHAHPDPAHAGYRAAPRFWLGDGVGCEACHGPAEKWLGLHYKDEWRDLPEGARAALGFVPTKDLRVRAEVCAGCHVGRGEMDVNHDLIASGHPRLRFEFGAYLANYHGRHWRLRDEKARHADHESRAWLLGQLVSAQTALEQTAHRAERAETKPWPEFAEYNCAACHHDLGAPGPRGLGKLPWGTWYHALPRRLPGAGEDVVRSLDKVEALMRKRLPPEKEVALAAREAAGALHRWAVAVGRAPVDPPAWRSLFLRLAGPGRPDTGNWESATQLYLGLGALNVDLPLDAGRSAALRAVGRALDEVFPRGRESAYHTPTRFDPAEVRRRLDEVRARAK